MARPQKKGLAYFPLDVDLFSDTKIKIIRGKYGNDSISLYLYLLCEIYKNGYYIKADEDFLAVVSADLGMTEEKIGQMLSFFRKRSLFDDTLFTADKILTSGAIQRRYQDAVKQRAMKNPVQVNEKFWLLSKEETQSFIKVHPYNGFSENNNGFSENNNVFSENNPHKVKESKVNKSKVNNVCPADSYGTHGHVRLTTEQYDSLIKEYGKCVIDDYIERVDDYVENSGKKPYNNHYKTITNWLSKDGVSKKPSHSYDLDRLIDHAMNNTPIIKENKEK